MSKKTLFSFYSLLSSSLCISHNFLLLFIFFSSLLLALIHALLQDYTVLSLTHWDSPLLFSSSTPNGRMAFPFISSPFSSFLPSTLFTTSHNKCKHTSLDFCTFLQKTHGAIEERDWGPQFGEIHTQRAKCWASSLHEW